MNACVYVCVFVCVYLTERPYEFSLHGPRECIDETGRCESNKQNVVQEHNVEVPQPVVPTKVPQQIETSDAYDQTDDR